MFQNKKFDRIEFDHDNFYSTHRGGRLIGETLFEGFIKCKLVHTDYCSIIIPDLIYILTENNRFIWFQIASFLPNFIGIYSENEIHCGIHVDIAFGNTLKIIFESEGHIKNLKDNSNLFRCKIYAHPDLYEFATGEGHFHDDEPYVKLYHHTTPESKKLIQSGKYYLGSKWNFQGTKELVNINYCYFTSLDKIEKPNDLRMIAMANDENIPLILDDDTNLSIKVYRSTPEERTASIMQYVPCSIIPNNHIFKHWDYKEDYTFYEYATPFIYRVGIFPLEKLLFDNEKILQGNSIKKLDYIIIGDCTTIEGITAPYDEENTASVFKIEKFDGQEDNILKFWRRNQNTDQYNHKTVELQKFKDSSP